MKLFILTNCSAEKNHTPQVFMNKKDAKKGLKEMYDELVYVKDYTEDLDNLKLFYDSTVNKYVKPGIFSWEIYNVSAEIIYTDDTYDVFEIFEINTEVEEYV